MRDDDAGGARFSSCLNARRCRLGPQSGLYLVNPAKEDVLRVPTVSKSESSILASGGGDVEAEEGMCGRMVEAIEQPIAAFAF